MPNIAKPGKLKELSGNPGKRPVNKTEPKPSTGPAAPTVMSPRAKTVWAKLIKAMPPGVFTSCDSHLLAAYCEAAAMHQIATANLIKGPHEAKGSTGQTKLSPWFAAQADAARLIVQLGAKLGLDPVSRQHINAEGGDKIDDEFGDLIH
jgi:P27 family predicted phage terminase small subunit